MAYERDGDGALAWLLVDVDEDGGDEEDDGEAHGVGHPDQACFDERHVDGCSRRRKRKRKGGRRRKSGRGKERGKEEEEGEDLGGERHGCRPAFALPVCVVPSLIDVSCELGA